MAVVLAIISALVVSQHFGKHTTAAPSWRDQTSTPMLELAKSRGISLVSSGRPMSLDEMTRNVEAAKQAFGFAAEAEVDSVEEVLVTMEGEREWQQRTMVLVILDGVRQPAFGAGQEEPQHDVPRPFFLFLEPDTSRPVYAISL